LRRNGQKKEGTRLDWDQGLKQKTGKENRGRSDGDKFLKADNTSPGAKEGKCALNGEAIIKGDSREIFTQRCWNSPDDKDTNPQQIAQGVQSVQVEQPVSSTLRGGLCELVGWVPDHSAYRFSGTTGI